MTPKEFQYLRWPLGSLTEVSNMLGINRRTLQRLEAGHSNFVDDQGQVPEKYETMILNLDREMQS